MKKIFKIEHEGYVWIVKKEIEVTFSGLSDVFHVINEKHKIDIFVRSWDDAMNYIIYYTDEFKEA